MTPSKRADELIALSSEERRTQLATLSEEERKGLRPYWAVWAHEGQLPPDGAWHTWVIMAGRGYGKTRAGAEWVRSIAEADPTARIALVGDSLGEARRVMVEGPSGLLAIARPKWRPAFEPSKRQLTWPNGATATLYSAGEPESLRGPQHSHALRAVAERVLRQRGACLDRCLAARRVRGRNGGSTGNAGRGRGLARRQRRKR
jgi:phage terminase large subunit-like protein